MGETRTITGELRELLADVNWGEINDHMRLDDRGAIFDGDWLESWHAAAGHACDAIDAVHANLERENASLKAELDRVLGEQEDRDGWVRLPVDADGVPVCIGDVLEWPDGSDEPFEVVGIGLSGTVYCMYDESCEWTNASTKRHHRPDTWERIIRDAIGEGMARQRSNDGSECCERANPMNNDALVARCKALAGDAS